MSDADFREGHTKLQPGEILVIYSDGVSEAVNPSGEEFGPTRLYEVVARTSTGQPAVFATVSNPR